MKNKYTNEEYNLRECDDENNFLEQGYSLNKEFTPVVEGDRIIWKHFVKPSQIVTNKSGVVIEYTVDGNTWEECDECSVREIAHYLRQN